MPNLGHAAEQELDRILQGENQQKGVSGTATPFIDDLAYLRRVSIDLIGRIPTGSEIKAYLALPQETRRTKTVDRLMKDSRFAGRANFRLILGDVLASKHRLHPEVIEAIRDERRTAGVKLVAN
ncbi:MAG: DUF1549 domain-containing protein, partial [Acidobacteria bacterium]|nr:DUF1549 domain-containing protein [Acidobacteriota bacterium]